MSDNIQSSTGADTSTLFSTTGTKSGTSHIQNSASQDLYAVYAQYTSGTKITTGIQDSAGNDIGQILQPIAGGAALSAAITPNPYNHSLQAPGAETATMSCSASGGTGPYTYTWTVTGTGITLTNASTATVTLNYTVPTHGGTSTVYTLTCTVHDSASHTTAPTATFTYTGPP